MTSGVFVTFEGPNGCGKSTILDAVYHSLQESYDVYKTQEPTTTSLGKFARESERVLFGKSLAYVIAEDRRSHVEYFIRPALERGTIVLCDRYIESSLVLQKLDGLDNDFIWSLNGGILIPDLSVILLANENILEQRLCERSRLSRFEETVSRKDELLTYQSAIDFIIKKGFNVLVLDNGQTGVSENTKRIIEKIEEIHRRKANHGR